jgi:hypothetical protein
MILTSPFVLAALVFAATPVIIFILLRRRKREVDWGAGYLIRLTLQSRRRASLWKQYLVLVVRTLIIILMVLLLAGVLRPNPAPTHTVPALPDAPVHRVVLLDNSLSMRVGEGSNTRFTLARRVLGNLCNSQRIGDRLTILPLVNDPNGVRQISFSGRLPEDTARALTELATREGKVTLSPGLAAAFTALARTPEAVAEIYILSDFPRELNDDLAHLDWVQEALQQSAARLVMVNIASAQEHAPNVVVRDVQVGSDFVLAGIPFAVYVDAVNYSDVEITANFDILLGGQTKSRQAVAFKPNEKRRFPLWMTLDQPGTALLAVQTDQSRLEQHRKRSLSLAVRDTMKIWIAAEEQDATADQAVDESEFLLRAVNKPQDKGHSIHAEKVPLSVLTRDIPDDVDLVILAAPRFAVPTTAEVLETFVRRGGGLILAMGPAMEIRGYNDKYRTFLPAPLLGAARAKVVPDQFSLVRREATSGASPLFDEFATETGGDLGRTRIYNYMRFNEDELEGDVLFRLADDAPLVLERRVGRGRVFVFASTLGISWNSLPVRQGFIPFWVRLIHAATAGREPTRNIRTGETLVLPWPAAGTVQLTQPDQRHVELAVVAWRKEAFVQLAAPSQQGVYQLTGTTPDSEQTVDYFTVHGPTSEGDLRSLEADAQGRLEATLGVSIFACWPEAVDKLGAADATYALWPWLLVMMLGLYTFEAWFVRKL